LNTNIVYRLGLENSNELKKRHNTNIITYIVLYVLQKEQTLTKAKCAAVVLRLYHFALY